MHYTLTFGRTVRPADFESIRVEYAQDFDDEAVPREAAYQDVRTFVAGKIEEELALFAGKKAPESPPAAPPKAPPAASTYGLTGKPPIPTFNLTGLTGLPWRTFKDKQPCKPGEAGWIFSNTPGAEDLAKLIDLKGLATVAMDGKAMTCKFSGEDRMFINRAPAVASEKS